MRCNHFLQEHALGARDVLDRLPRHGFRHESDEIAGMARLHRHADLAVGLESTDSGAMPGTRIDDDEGTTLQIDLDSLWRCYSHQSVVDGPLESSAIDNQFNTVVEDVRHGFGQMFAVLRAA